MTGMRQRNNVWRVEPLKKAVSILIIGLLLVQTAFAGAGGSQLKDSFNYGESAQIDFSNEMEYPYYSAVLKEYQEKGYNFEPAQELSVPPKKFRGTGKSPL